MKHSLGKLMNNEEKSIHAKQSPVFSSVSCSETSRCLVVNPSVSCSDTSDSPQCLVVTPVTPLSVL